MSIPVTLLTGFLGAGKTTVLNAMLRAMPTRRFAIIENEFGEADIDSELVVKAAEDIIALNNGCICCTLNDNLLDILHDLYQRRDRFDELIIETTGIADPAGVASVFMLHPAVARDFSLQRVICLVDAVQIGERLQDTEEAARQIAFSDCLLLNKTDLVDTDTLQSLVQGLAAINPWAHILQGQEGSYPVEALWQHTREDHLALSTDQVPYEHAHHPQHGHPHHGDIVSLGFRYDLPFDLPALRQRLMALLLFQGKDVYRIKGILWAVGHSHKMILQSVGKQLALTQGAEWAPHETPASRIVFIGKGLQPAGYEKLLQHCLHKEPA